MALSREVIVESKRIMLAKEGVNISITEQGWKDKYEVLWFVRTLEECLRGGRKKVYSVVREGYRSFVAQRCAYNRGRFLSIAEYGQVGRKCVLCFPEGVGGWG